MNQILEDYSPPVIAYVIPDHIDLFKPNRDPIIYDKFNHLCKTILRRVDDIFLGYDPVMYKFASPPFKFGDNSSIRYIEETIILRCEHIYVLTTVKDNSELWDSTKVKLDIAINQFAKDTLIWDINRPEELGIPDWIPRFP